MSSQQQKEKTLEALLDQIAGVAARAPVLAVYEDVHWADPTTMELLSLLVDRIPTLPVLALITFRPELAPPWIGHSHVTGLTLNRLTRRQSAMLAERVAADEPLPAAVRDQIVARTDGVPLFVEELTKTLVESGILREEGGHMRVEPLPPLTLSLSVQD